MKFKRLISMLLSLVMVASCLTAMPIVAQATTGFTNLVADPGFDGTLDENVWVMSTSAEGKITIETDTKDSTNKVLRVDCSENTKSISYVNYTSLNKGTYYIHFKVRLAEKDATTDANHYLLANSMSGETKNYNATRPAITKDGWAECYGVWTVTADNTKVGFKVINTQGTAGSNVAKAVYEFDDFTIYNLADAKTISVPAGTEFTSDNVVKSHLGTCYAMPGSSVTLTYEKDGYTLAADTTDITKSGNSYTFTMGSSDVIISEVDDTPATEFENLVADPGFDGTLDENVWVMSTSAEGKITIETDTKDSTNKVLRVDCSENTKSISYVNYTSLNKGTYYIHFKVRLAEKDATTDANHYLLANSMSGETKNYNATRPAITKDGWAECYGVWTVTADNTKVGFKVINTQGTAGSNVAKAVYEFDDFTIYNLADAKTISVPAGAEFTSDNVVKSHLGTYYAVQGSEVTFTYAKDGYTLEATGAELTQDGTTYTFTVGNTAVTITEVEEAPSTEFENLVADPGFDGAYDSAIWLMSTSTNAKGTVSIVTDKKDAENKVLRVDCSSNGTESNKISYVNYKANGTGLAAGKYYMHCKIRLADVDQPAADNYYVYAASLGGADVLYWDATRPAITKDGWAECYGVFDAAANASVGFKIIYTQGASNNNVGKAVYEIDDFTIYNLENASNIEVPTGINFTSDNVAKSHDNTYYAVNGSEIAFNYAGEGLEALYINGETATANEGVYTLAVSEDAIVLAVANQADDETVKYAYTAGKPYAIFEDAATVTVIVAGHDDAGVLNSMNVAVITGTEGQILDLNTVDEFKAITGWANKTIFTWDSLNTLTPIRSKCILKDL